MEDKEYEKVLNDINKAPSQWSVDEMIENLSKFKLNFYRKKFKQNRIDGNTFLKMENFKNILDNSDSEAEDLVNCQQNLKKFQKKFISKESKKNIPVSNNEDLTKKYGPNKNKLKDIDIVESQIGIEENLKKKKKKESIKPEKGKIQRIQSESEEEEEIPKEKNVNKNKKYNVINNIKHIESGSEEEEVISKEKNVNINKPFQKIKLIESGSEEEEEIPIEKNYKKLNPVSKKNQIESGSEEEEEIPKKKKFNDFEMPKISKEKKVNKNNYDPSDEPTIKIGKKKKCIHSSDDDNSNNDEITRKRIKKVIPLVLIAMNEEKKEYKIENTCKIGRSLGNNIRITDREISNNHAEINLIDFNFYIKDNGSSNGTYIKLMEDSNLKITEDMIFDVGSHFLKILSLDIDNKSIEVGFSNEVDFDKIENFSAKLVGSKTEIIFGKNPPKSKSNIEFTKYNNLAAQHGMFIFNDKKEFEIRPLKSENGIWLKLEIPDRSKFPFCRLIPNMQIRFSDNHKFIVKECHFSDLKSCEKCDNIRNSINLDCLHSIYCFDCAKRKFKKNEKKCLECKNNIESIQEIINIMNK